MARSIPVLNTKIEFFKNDGGTREYSTSVGVTYCDLKRVSGMDDETETDKFSMARYKAILRVPGNFTPLPRHRVQVKLRRENTTRTMRIISIAETDLRGKWLVALLEDHPRDN